MIRNMLKFVFKMYLANCRYLVDDPYDSFAYTSQSAQNFAKNDIKITPTQTATKYEISTQPVLKEKLLDAIYIYSVGGDGLIDYRTSLNNEEMELNHYRYAPKPFYLKKVNGKNGVVLTVSPTVEKTTKGNKALDLSRTTSNLITYDYHGGVNQIFYFKPADKCSFMIEVENLCLFYDSDAKSFGTNKCDNREQNKNYLFRLFKESDERGDEMGNKKRILSISKAEYEDAIRKYYI